MDGLQLGIVEVLQLPQREACGAVPRRLPLPSASACTPWWSQECNCVADGEVQQLQRLIPVNVSTQGALRAAQCIAHLAVRLCHRANPQESLR